VGNDTDGGANQSDDADGEDTPNLRHHERRVVVRFAHSPDQIGNSEDDPESIRNISIPSM